MSSLIHCRSLSFARVATCILLSAISASASYGQTAELEFTVPPEVARSRLRVETFSVEVENESGGLRRYRLNTTQPQRDNKPRERVVPEHPGLPRVRTGNLAFDALFAQALDDMRLNSVSEIRDRSYDGGEPIPHEFFQTGEKWHYVWTRDLSYAAYLGIAAMDPHRTAESLFFKTSEFRAPELKPPSLPSAKQIVQDTGTGGGWPVSTDRISWAWAADALLPALTPDQRIDFAGQVMPALVGSIEADRVFAFDPETGLYGGEQSFLDWRDQTYAPWQREDTVSIASGKALSTNVCHYKALRLAAQLGKILGDRDAVLAYDQWAADLVEAINARFWMPEEQLYASILEPGARARPVYRFDLLATALVVVSGIAPDDRAQAILSHYPHGPYGAPVYHPQQPDVRVYHNRAMWPFVTAFSLEAAQHAQHVSFADQAIETLIRGAALNLSNMENFEWLTGLPFYDDGPAINSRRQLWSVGGYLSMVLKTTFGLHLTESGLQLSPFLTAKMRTRFGDEEEISLHGFRYLGKRIDVILRLPPQSASQGYFPLASVTLNGAESTELISPDALRSFATNTLVLTFGDLIETTDRIRELPAVPLRDRHHARVFAPECPVLTIETIEGESRLVLSDPDNAAEDTRYEIFRDGVKMGATEEPGILPFPPGESFARHY